MDEPGGGRLSGVGQGVAGREEEWGGERGKYARKMEKQSNARAGEEAEKKARRKEEDADP
jgi:hypothetical protein